MICNVYNFRLDLNWKVVQMLSKIDRFDANWSAIERVEGSKNLRYLKTMATVRSVGASTRIEGSLMDDESIALFLEAISIQKFEERDAQEVAGYFNVLELISESYKDIVISASNIKSMHNILLKYSTKDDWHRGDFKQLSNVVEANFLDGTRQVIFKTTEPGYATEDAMRSLLDWYGKEQEVHPIIKVALLTYEFLSVHPFQDGNGRLSRLITNLAMMHNGYTWIQYVSFEHEIENRKSDYYRLLRSCQAQRPYEDVSEWVVFFLSCVLTIQAALMEKIEGFSYTDPTMTSKEKMIHNFIVHYPASSSGVIAEKLQLNLSTTKKLLAQMIDKNLIVKSGVGRGVVYAVIQ
jgi:Fic family protein